MGWWLGDSTMTNSPLMMGMMEFSSQQKGDHGIVEFLKQQAKRGPDKTWFVCCFNNDWLVGGLVAIFYYPIYWECPHPNWLIFFKGVQTTNQVVSTMIDLSDHGQKIFLVVAEVKALRPLKALEWSRSMHRNCILKCENEKHHDAWWASPLTSLFITKPIMNGRYI